MSRPTENETWLIQVGGEILETRALSNEERPPLERLIHSFWVADYGMRNAGDLATAADLFPAFKAEGLVAARELGLVRCLELFSLEQAELERRYFELFEEACGELVTAWNDAS